MLNSKTVIVTGASRGIGRSIARACLKHGAIVGVGFKESLDEALELQREFPQQVRLMRYDLRNPDQITEAFETFLHDAGSIDGLVNNAAICREPGLLISAKSDNIEDTVRTNLLGPIYCTKVAIRQMIRQKAGSIVNISSIASIRPTSGVSWYAATKGGLESFTYAAAVEYAKKGVRVNCVRPGHMETDMLESFGKPFRESLTSSIPLNRIGNPDDVADLVTYLLGDKASYITGSVFTLDGGASIRG